MTDPLLERLRQANKANLKYERDLKDWRYRLALAQRKAYPPGSVTTNIPAYEDHEAESSEVTLVIIPDNFTSNWKKENPRPIPDPIIEELDSLRKSYRNRAKNESVSS